ATQPAAPAPVAQPAAEAPKQVASALPAGNAANGEKLSGKCKACHNFNDKKKVGPGLAGVFGRKVGQMADMSYSDSLQKGKWVWDAAHLAAWACDSAAAVKEFTGDAGAKTKMPAVHICDPQQQADLIAFLKTQ
ncbi:MAG TPA: c-type cytochrome, partial [Mariprofundaceae bacterium]|nr:c-type cytochrome [Mariprofundaceae bacterium]